MPEGPEVRRHADRLHAALAARPLRVVEARTKAARAWLEAHPGALPGRRVERVVSHGKHLVGHVEGGYYFASHLLMWGRWHVVPPDDERVATRDRRERARLVTDDAAALLYSAPVFHVGHGDPAAHVPWLGDLGPDALPYDGPAAFDAAAFRARLHADPDRAVGAALLDQTVVAGLGNYLRAEVLFACRLDPWRRVGDLTAADLDALGEAVPALAAQAYATGGRTVPDDVQARMRADPALTYAAASDWNTRHWVFRRTNLPCLACGGLVRQKRQAVHTRPDGTENERIVYFCPTCQGTSVPLAPARRRAAAA